VTVVPWTSICQEVNIEDLAAVFGFIRSQEIEQQGGHFPLLEMAGDKIIARAESPAKASVGEDHHSKRLSRKAEDSFKGERALHKSDRRFIHCRPSGCVLHFFHLPITDEGPSRCRHGPAGRISRHLASHQSCRGGHATSSAPSLRGHSKLNSIPWGRKPRCTIPPRVRAEQSLRAVTVSLS